MNKKIVDLYVKIVGHYPSLWQEIRYHLLSEYMEPVNNYLDIWCGSWELILKNKDKFKSKYWVDITDERFSIYEDEIRANNITLIQADASKLDFENEFFDALSISEVLEHTFDYEKIISEISRVLKKGSKLYLTVPGPHDIENKYAHIGHVIPWFDYDTITALLDKYWFSILKKENFWWTLTNWITDLGLWNHPYLSWLLFPLGWILFKVERLLRKYLKDTAFFTYNSPSSWIFILAIKN